MGTHPIFESDFDCLTDFLEMYFRRLGLGLNIVRKQSLLSHHLKFTPVSSFALIQNRQFFGKKDEKSKEENADEKTEEKGEEQKELSMEELLKELNETKVALEKAQAGEKKLDELLKEEKENQYKIATLAEELKNQRTRLDREAEKAKVYGIKKFAKDLLPVADQLVMALDNVPQDGNENESLKSFIEGIEMTKTELSNVFERHHITLVSPSIGEEFDPEVHEAVMRVPRAQMPDAEPNTIAFIQKTGYNIKDHVLRPCWVGVIAD